MLVLVLRKRGERSLLIDFSVGIPYPRDCVFKLSRCIYWQARCSVENWCSCRGRVIIFPEMAGTVM